MKNKNIVIAIGAVLVIAVGVYFIAGQPSSSTESETSPSRSTSVETSSEGAQTSNTKPNTSTSQPSGGGSTAATPPPAPTSVASKSILGTRWTWQRTEFPNGLKTIPQDSSKFLITFEEDKQMSSMTDCNNLSAPFVINGPALNFGNIAATDMACTQVTTERKYTEELARTASYAIAGDELRLTLMNGPGTMVFKKYVAIGLEGTTFRLVSFNGNAIEGVYGGTYTIALKDDVLSAKFCNTFGGGYTLAAGRLTANMAGTKMNCASPSKLMEMEYAFTSAMQSGVQLSLKGSTLTLTGNQGEQFVFTASGN